MMKLVHWFTMPRFHLIHHWFTMAIVLRFHLILSKALSTPACASACAELMCSFLDRYPTLDTRDDSVTSPTRCKRLLLHVVQATYDKLFPLLEEVEAQKRSWWSLGLSSLKSSPSNGPDPRKKKKIFSKGEKGGKRNHNETFIWRKLGLSRVMAADGKIEWRLKLLFFWWP